MDYLSLVLLSLGLSLDDFTLAFALSLLIPSETLRKRIINASKMALAFSISTAVLPLLGWLVGLAIFEWIASFSAWVLLIVFCGVGVWIIKEAFENESPKWIKENISSFWVLLTIGILGSFDEGAVGIGYPFLEIPILWIIVSVILTNTVLIYFAMLISNWKKHLNRRIPHILSGIILIVLGIMNFLELAF
jgi:putative Mn2+ efflux pump MntP